MGNASLSRVLLGDGERVFSLRLILILSISTQKCFNHRTILYFSSARYFNRGEHDVSNNEDNNLPFDCINVDGDNWMPI